MIKMEIHNLQFGILSPAKMCSISVCEIITDELYCDGQPKSGGLRDPLFGVLSRRGQCTACGKTWSECSGHFGHYVLPCPLYHVGWMHEVFTVDDSGTSINHVLSYCEIRFIKGVGEIINRVAFIS